jgi:hypothetical protein
MSVRPRPWRAGGRARRSVVVLVVLALVLVTGLVGALVARHGVGDGLAIAITGRPRPAPGPCDGVSGDDVRGARPRYAEGGLAGFVNDESMCRGLWLPRADAWFVPQGLALDGRTAWVSGFRWRARFGNRPCQLLRVDLRTGEELAFQPRLEGQVPDGPSGIWCHHGGGLTMNDHGLWLAETGRLWLVDPERVGRTGAVRRVWRLSGSVSGGFLVAGDGDRFGLGDFHADRDSTIHWYRFSEVPARAVTVAPRHGQGGATRPARLRPYLTSSLSTCGVLVTPGGRRIAFAPGAEGIAFDGKGGVWAALESGSRGYQRRGRPLTPMLARFDLGQLRAGADENCTW